MNKLIIQWHTAAIVFTLLILSSLTLSSSLARYPTISATDRSTPVVTNENMVSLALTTNDRALQPTNSIPVITSQGHNVEMSQASQRNNETDALQTHNKVALDITETNQRSLLQLTNNRAVVANQRTALPTTNPRTAEKRQATNNKTVSTTQGSSDKRASATQLTNDERASATQATNDKRASANEEKGRRKRQFATSGLDFGTSDQISSLSFGSPSGGLLGLIGGGGLLGGNLGVFGDLGNFGSSSSSSILSSLGIGVGQTPLFPLSSSLSAGLLSQVSPSGFGLGDLQLGSFGGQSAFIPHKLPKLPTGFSDGLGTFVNGVKIESNNDFGFLGSPASNPYHSAFPKNIESPTKFSKSDRLRNLEREVAKDLESAVKDLTPEQRTTKAIYESISGILPETTNEATNSQLGFNKLPKSAGTRVAIPGGHTPTSNANFNNENVPEITLALPLSENQSQKPPSLSPLSNVFSSQSFNSQSFQSQPSTSQNPPSQFFPSNSQQSSPFPLQFTPSQPSLSTFPFSSSFSTRSTVSQPLTSPTLPQISPPTPQDKIIAQETKSNELHIGSTTESLSKDTSQFISQPFDIRPATGLKVKPPRLPRPISRRPQFPNGLKSRPTRPLSGRLKLNIRPVPPQRPKIRGPRIGRQRVKNTRRPPLGIPGSKDHSDQISRSQPHSQDLINDLKPSNIAVEEKIKFATETTLIKDHFQTNLDQAIESKADFTEPKPERPLIPRFRFRFKTPRPTDQTITKANAPHQNGPSQKIISAVNIVSDQTPKQQGNQINFTKDQISDRTPFSSPTLTPPLSKYQKFSPSKPQPPSVQKVSKTLRTLNISRFNLPTTSESNEDDGFVSFDALPETLIEKSVLNSNASFHKSDLEGNDSIQRSNLNTNPSLHRSDFDLDHTGSLKKSGGYSNASDHKSDLHNNASLPHPVSSDLLTKSPLLTSTLPVQTTSTALHTTPLSSTPQNIINSFVPVHKPISPTSLLPLPTLFTTTISSSVPPTPTKRSRNLSSFNSLPPFLNSSSIFLPGNISSLLPSPTSSSSPVSLNLSSSFSHPVFSSSQLPPLTSVFNLSSNLPNLSSEGSLPPLTSSLNFNFTSPILSSLSPSSSSLSLLGLRSLPSSHPLPVLNSSVSSSSILSSIPSSPVSNSSFYLSSVFYNISSFSSPVLNYSSISLPSINISSSLPSPVLSLISSLHPPKQNKNLISIPPTLNNLSSSLPPPVLSYITSLPSPILNKHSSAIPSLDKHSSSLHPTLNKPSSSSLPPSIISSITSLPPSVLYDRSTSTTPFPSSISSDPTLILYKLPQKTPELNETRTPHYPHTVKIDSPFPIKPPPETIINNSPVSPISKSRKSGKPQIQTSATVSSTIQEETGNTRMSTTTPQSQILRIPRIQTQSVSSNRTQAITNSNDSFSSIPIYSRKSGKPELRTDSVSTSTSTKSITRNYTSSSSVAINSRKAGRLRLHTTPTLLPSLETPSSQATITRNLPKTTINTNLPKTTTLHSQNTRIPQEQPTLATLTTQIVTNFTSTWPRIQPRRKTGNFNVSQLQNTPRSIPQKQLTNSQQRSQTPRKQSLTPSFSQLHPNRKTVPSNVSLNHNIQTITTTQRPSSNTPRITKATRVQIFPPTLSPIKLNRETIMSNASPSQIIQITKTQQKQPAVTPQTIRTIRKSNFSPSLSQTNSNKEKADSNTTTFQIRQITKLQRQSTTRPHRTLIQKQSFTPSIKSIPSEKAKENSTVSLLHNTSIQLKPEKLKDYISISRTPADQSNQRRALQSPIPVPLHPNSRTVIFTQTQAPNKLENYAPLSRTLPVRFNNHRNITETQIQKQLPITTSTIPTVSKLNNYVSLSLPLSYRSSSQRNAPQHPITTNTRTPLSENSQPKLPRLTNYVSLSRELPDRTNNYGNLQKPQESTTIKPQLNVTTDSEPKPSTRLRNYVSLSRPFVSQRKRNQSQLESSTQKNAYNSQQYITTQSTLIQSTGNSNQPKLVLPVQSINSQPQPHTIKQSNEPEQSLSSSFGRKLPSRLSNVNLKLPSISDTPQTRPNISQLNSTLPVKPATSNIKPTLPSTTQTSQNQPIDTYFTRKITVSPPTIQRTQPETTVESPQPELAKAPFNRSQASRKLTNNELQQSSQTTTISFSYKVPPVQTINHTLASKRTIPPQTPTILPHTITPLTQTDASQKSPPSRMILKVRKRLMGSYAWEDLGSDTTAILGGREREDRGGREMEIRGGVEETRGEGNKGTDNEENSRGAIGERDNKKQEANKRQETNIDAEWIEGHIHKQEEHIGKTRNINARLNTADLDTAMNKGISETEPINSEWANRREIDNRKVTERRNGENEEVIEGGVKIRNKKNDKIELDATNINKEQNSAELIKLEESRRVEVVQDRSGESGYGDRIGRIGQEGSLSRMLRIIRTRESMTDSIEKNDKYEIEKTSEKEENKEGGGHRDDKDIESDHRTLNKNIHDENREQPDIERERKNNHTLVIRLSGFKTKQN